MTPPESRSADSDGPLSREAVDSHTAVEIPDVLPGSEQSYTGVECPESPSEFERPPADEQTPAALPHEPEAVEQSDESPDERRRAALGSFLVEFMERTAVEHESDPVPHFLELGGRPVELGLWERSVLKKSRDPRNRNIARTSSLLAESVAFLVSCEDVLDRMEHGPLPPAADLPAFQDRIVADIAVGIVLEGQLQNGVERRIADGQLADAKALEAFKNNLAQRASNLRDCVGSNEIERAERLAIEFGGCDPDEAEVPQDPCALDKKVEAPVGTTFKRREGELPPWLTEGEAPDATTPDPSTAKPTARRRSLLGPMLLVLAFLLVVYGVVMLPRGLRTQLPVLSLDMFAHLESVQQISARPPSLFVRLDGKAWDAASAQYRLELVEEIGRIAGDRGYSGAHVVTDDGATVGQWLSNTGVRIIPRPATSS